MQDSASIGIVVADQAFYISAIESGLDVSEVEEIERVEGRFIAIPSIADSIRKYLEVTKSFHSGLTLGWGSKVKIDSDRYFDVINRHSSESDQTRAEIGEYQRKFRKAVRILEGGASPEDCDLLANAVWIMEKTGRHTSVVTDDRDLLCSGHVLSSYLGIRVAFRSLFEVLKAMDMTEALRRYCQHYHLSQDIDYEAGEKVDNLILVNYFSELSRQAKLSFHPTLARGAPIGTLLRRG